MPTPYKRPDHFTRQAKASGYPARSVFKLEEIDHRAKLLHPGQRVLDLGAAPGSWALYASSRIGDRGKLFAIDLQPLAQALAPNSTFLQADLRNLPIDRVAVHAPYDVVLSDMAPATSGNRGQDQARSHELFCLAVSVAEQLGAEGSSFVGKIFMGPDFESARRLVRETYGAERLIRPEGTRSSSFEIFVIGTKKRRPASAIPAP